MNYQVYSDGEKPALLGYFQTGEIKGSSLVLALPMSDMGSVRQMILPMVKMTRKFGRIEVESANDKLFLRTFNIPDYAERQNHLTTDSVIFTWMVIQVSLENYDDFFDASAFVPYGDSDSDSTSWFTFAKPTPSYVGTVTVPHTGDYTTGSPGVVGTTAGYVYGGSSAGAAGGSLGGSGSITYTMPEGAAHTVTMMGGGGGSVSHDLEKYVLKPEEAKKITGMTLDNAWIDETKYLDLSKFIKK